MSLRFKEDKLLFRLIAGGDFTDTMNRGYLVRDDCERVDLNKNLAWNYGDRNLRFNINAWRFLNPAVSYYFSSQSEEKVKGQELCKLYKRIIEDWKNNALDNSNKFVWYDMAVGIRAMHLAFFLYLIERAYFNISNDFMSTLNAIVNMHLDWLSQKKNITEGNHAVYEIVGLKLLSFILCHNKYDDFCSSELEILFDKAFDKNFVSTENSPFYHKYNIDLFLKIPREIFPSLHRKLQSIKNEGMPITKWLTDSRGYFYQIGDTEGKGILLTSNDIKDINGTKIEGLVYKDLGESGYQVVRSVPESNLNDDFFLVFRGISPSNVHRHCDALSIILGFRGREIISDSGKYTYEHSQDRDLIVSDNAHSTAGNFRKAYMPNHINSKHQALLPVRAFSDKIHLSGNVVKRNEFFHNRNITIFSKSKLRIYDYASSPDGDLSEVRFLFSEDIISVDITGNTIVLENKIGDFIYLNLSGNISSIKLISPEMEEAWISRKYLVRSFVFKIIVYSLESNFNLITDIEII